MRYNNNKEMPTWMIIFIGILFMIISVCIIKQDIETKNRMDSYTQSTNVTFKVVQRKEDGQTKTTYMPKYHYSVDGASYVCTSNYSSSFKSRKNKKIYYESANPRSCFVEVGIGDFFFKGLFFIIGFLTTILGTKIHKNKYNDKRNEA